MKLTLLLLVVFVSTTLASPFYLRGRDQQSHRPGGPGGDNRRPKQKPDSSEDREGPCERAMKHCDEEAQAEKGSARSATGGSGSEQQAAADKDVEDCKSLLDSERNEFENTARRDVTSDTADLNELDNDIVACKLRIEGCAVPKNDNDPVARVLQMLARNGEMDGKNPCRAAREKMENKGPCEKAMKRCEEDPKTQRSVEGETEADEDVEACVAELEDARQTLNEKRRRDLSSDDEELQKLDEVIDECKAKIEICAIPKENPARRVLQLLTREGGTEGTDPCQDAREKIESMGGDDSNDSSDESETDSDGATKRKVLRELIRNLYSRK